ncbi:hypothetical protein C8R45DRAFT_918182 [Mycena sanguinolenta]|nr:hypothetical protein C8R45DRAFT_918182 [Mycena sanguinolenta]
MTARAMPTPMASRARYPRESSWRRGGLTNEGRKDPEIARSRKHGATSKVSTVSDVSLVPYMASVIFLFAPVKRWSPEEDRKRKQAVFHRSEYFASSSSNGPV